VFVFVKRYKKKQEKKKEKELKTVQCLINH